MTVTEILSVPSSWLATRARKGTINVTRLGHYIRFTLDDLKSIAKDGGEPKNQSFRKGTQVSAGARSNHGTKPF